MARPYVEFFSNSFLMATTLSTLFTCELRIFQNAVAVFCGRLAQYWMVTYFAIQIAATKRRDSVRSLRARARLCESLTVLRLLVYYSTQ